MWRAIEQDYRLFERKMANAITEVPFRVCVITLYGDEVVYQTVAEAIRELENPTAARELNLAFARGYEVFIDYASGSSVTGTRSGRIASIAFSITRVVCGYLDTVNHGKNKVRVRMSQPLSPSAQKVQDALAALGLSCQVVELSQTTRSAAEAAEAIDCRIEQIAKSLIFKGKRTARPILVIASGTNRVKEKRVGEYLGEPLEKADADFVHQHTGFVIGGVPPVGHLERLEVFIDEDLLQYEEIWAAAGNPHAVFQLAPADLITMTGGRVVPIK
jgi:prolyl-tRNA editing enzyme YbaK/EbsC (Cys-tRNA(Pro) deacylase)